MALPSRDVQLLEVNDSGCASTIEQVKDNTKLSGTYYQCRAGRDATFLDRAIETATSSTLGCTVGGEQARVGAFDSEQHLDRTCFVGSRVLKGIMVANQSISLSFDPAIMTCITCKKEHSVVTGTKPVCV